MKKYILAIVWQVMRDHTLQIIGGKTEKDLVDWANSVVDPDHKVQDLKDKSISNSMFHFVAPASAGNDRGPISMLGGTTSNVLVFANKITGYDYRTSKTGVTQYAVSANLPTGLTGFNEYWDLTGTKAALKAIFSEPSGTAKLEQVTLIPGSLLCFNTI